jgi:hypothetical protein
MSMTYCVVYILSCFTKHSSQYRVLMLGRVLGGIATSLLFSSFESWLVAEHFKVDFTRQIFSWIVQLLSFISCNCGEPKSS